jgi:hypothetical protein
LQVFLQWIKHAVEFQLDHIVDLHHAFQEWHTVLTEDNTCFGIHITPLMLPMSSLPTDSSQDHLQTYTQSTSKLWLLFPWIRLVVHGKKFLYIKTVCSWKCHWKWLSIANAMLI